MSPTLLHLPMEKRECNLIASRRMFNLLFVLLSLALTPALVAGQAESKPRVFLDPQSVFSTYFADGLQKKHVPVILTADPKEADYTVTFKAESKTGKRAQPITQAGVGDEYYSGGWYKVSMTVVSSKTEVPVFNYACKKSSGDRRVWSVAECLAKHWKRNLEKR
jgi:hypothetical protein